MHYRTKYPYSKNLKHSCMSRRAPDKPLKAFVFALAVLAIVALSGCDQVITRSLGGTTTYVLPAGAELVNITWKDSNLWVLYYEPATKSCVFAEQAYVGNLEGKVLIPNCNPLMLAK